MELSTILLGPDNGLWNRRNKFASTRVHNLLHIFSPSPGVDARKDNVIGCLLGGTGSGVNEMAYTLKPLHRVFINLLNIVLLQQFHEIELFMNMHYM